MCTKDGTFRTNMRRLSRLVRYVLVPALLFALTATLPGSGISATDNDERGKAQALLDKAVNLMDIQLPGDQPFLLAAETTWTEGDTTAHGKLAIAWQAPNRYRNEVASPGFLQVVVVAGNVLWRTRNVDHLSFAAFEAEQMLDVSGTLTHWPKKEIKIDNTDPQESQATNSTCIVGSTELNRDTIHHVACFDGTGRLLFYKRRMSTGASTLTYSSYVAVGDNQFPTAISYSDTTGARGELKVTKLDTRVSFPVGTFQRPDKSSEEAWCETPRYGDSPETPWAFHQWRTWGTGPVFRIDGPYVFVVVDAKGGVKKARLLNNFLWPWSDMAIEEIRRARLPVKTCGAQAIPYETVLQLTGTDR